jgi:pyruvate dehydrogenase phosphatase
MLPKLLPPDVPHRPPPRNFNTPPYVTAEPEVQYRKFTLPSSPSDASSSTLRFLILATDGLWDELSSNDAVALVAAHISGQRGSIAKAQLSKQLPLLEDFGDKTSAPLPHTPRSGNVKWAFRDEGLGMHLIRNACGGEDEIAIRKTLSIPAPYSRRFRDDITVAVITFDSTDMQPSKVPVKL